MPGSDTAAEQPEARAEPRNGTYRDWSDGSLRDASSGANPAHDPGIRPDSVRVSGIEALETEPGDPRDAGEAKQVRWTPAIRCAEPRQGDAGSPCASECAGPPVLAESGALGEPDLPQLRVTPQVVEVPVGFRGSSEVASEPAREASGSESAAHVGVETRLDLERAEGTDGDAPSNRGLEDQDVGTRGRGEERSSCSGQRASWISARRIRVSAAGAACRPGGGTTRQHGEPVRSPPFPGQLRGLQSVRSGARTRESVPGSFGRFGRIETCRTLPLGSTATSGRLPESREQSVAHALPILRVTG